MIPHPCVLCPPSPGALAWLAVVVAVAGSFLVAGGEGDADQKCGESDGS